MNNETSIDLDPNDPEFRPRRPCRHVSGDPDCDCHDDEEDEIGEGTMNEHFEAHIAEEDEE